MSIGLAVTVAYLTILAVLSLYGVHRYWILYLYWKHYKKAPPLVAPPPPVDWPKVTVQLPIYNEVYVVERLIDSICALDYPRDRLEIQVLDDSNDHTQALAQNKTAEMRARGFDVRYVRRADRHGYKAGALANGLREAAGEFVAIFDADFLPPADFLRRTVPHFADPRLGLVQARWGHVNAGYSLLTRLQALFLDGHFMIEHTARNRSGAFFNFNGTAGVWRRSTIDDAGGWSDDTLTEDLDISYRAQLKGWRFLFLPDLVCPAELPVDIGAFRTQQHRWTKGALQVAMKILPAVWRSDLPFLVKLEGTVHLTSNLGYPLVFILSLLLLPSLIARQLLAWPAAVNLLELAAFFLTALSITLFYLAVQKEVGAKDCRLSLADLPPLMALGLGMCLNNSRAIVEAVLDVPTEFQRTAKYDIRRTGEPWRHKMYRSLRGRPGLAEALLSAYFLLTFLWGLAVDNWLVLPFVAIFLFGYTYVGLLSIAHAFQTSE
jgi:cellulose synthase/poly-beta-1,6-N-acetylglucosamine synthase-like glycosyltransferase